LNYEDYKNLIDIICDHSLELKSNDRVLLEFIDVTDNDIIVIVELILKKELIPYIIIKSNNLYSKINNLYSANDFKTIGNSELTFLKNSVALIGFRAIQNQYDILQISDNQLNLMLENYLTPVHYNYRNNNLKWLYFRIPTQALAQNSKMSFTKFNNYYKEALFINYNKLLSQANLIERLLLDCNDIRVFSTNGTDLTFSIKDMDVYKSIGQHNLPDGEIFTAPQLNSVNGKIKFNIPTTYYGYYFKTIMLEYNNGVLVNYEVQGSKRDFESLLFLDEGSSKFGEFAFGINKMVKKPINDILFDEKMFGSIHFALGNAYKESDNGNRSKIHWDIILNLNKEWGGGEIYFDDQIVMKDGVFCYEDLKLLNE
jgi:aminopeptidase